MLSIPTLAKQSILRPLDEVVIAGASGGEVAVRDGAGREYGREKASARVRFTVGGALGTHVAQVVDRQGRVKEEARFRVDCETGISDTRKREFERLLTLLYYTMIRWRESDTQLVSGKVYKYFVGWLRDHVHTLKGMKYFYPDLTSGIDLYRDTQRKDGMIWDNIYGRGKRANYWDQIFTPGGFIRQLPEKRLEMKRIPVENDVEYLFLEGIYYTWKATGDDAWMQSCLPSALKAVAYSFGDDDYRWSKKLQLLKRGYTIDTWDFQPEEDTKLTGHAMVVTPGKSRFGAFHGDNTGMAASLRYLAEMLERVGKKSDAAKWRKRSSELKQRLDEVAWNGRFYRQHVPEDASVVRDLGVDLDAQVSMSNAYALNRGVTQEQAEAIIGEYQRIRANLPSGSAGEWYSVFPWYGKGFGGHNAAGEYMNGGVNVITAGELAHGAFAHGFEDYGVDILRRVKELAERHDGYLDCCFRGFIERPAERHFHPLDLSASANCDFRGEGGGAAGVPAWTNEGPNDLHEMVVGEQTFDGVPYRVADPSANGRRGCVAISSREGYARRVDIPIGRSAKSLYFLHTVSGGSGIAGLLTIAYADGTTHQKYIRRDQEVLAWWMPPEKRHPRLRIAWEGKNTTCQRVGVSQWGFDNPQPAKEISRIMLEAAADGAQWMVCAITLGDEPAWFEPSDVSFGIPDNWGAAAVVYALVEGLAGVVDRGVAFDRIALAPRWPAAGVDEATARIRYPASDGYVAYAYRHDRARKRLSATVTGGGKSAECSFLLPAKAKKVMKVTIDGDAVEFSQYRLRDSLYAQFALDLGAPKDVVVSYG